MPKKLEGGNVICEHCGHNKAVKSQEPRELICWSLGPFELRLWRWRDVLLCDECDIDHGPDRELLEAQSAAYYEGHQDGWLEAQTRGGQW